MELLITQSIKSIKKLPKYINILELPWANRFFVTDRKCLTHSHPTGLSVPKTDL